MSQTTSIEIPLDQFDCTLLPEHARQPGTEAFQHAVVAFFQGELEQAAERIQVSIEERVIRVAWRAEAEVDPLRLAIGRLKAGDYPRGLQLLRIAQRLRPNDARVRYNLGMALSDTGQLDEALEHLRRAADDEPDVADVHVALGVALFRKGFIAEAKPVLESAVRLEPDNPYALRNLAGCLLRLDEPPLQAIELLRKATTLLPDDQQGWIGLGQALEAQGDHPGADDAYSRGIQTNPGSDLAEIAKKGRSRLAQKTMRSAVGGGVRPDAVMYCLAALEKSDGLAPAEIQKIAFEIAALGTKGINPNDSHRKHKLRTLSGEFTGLQLLCYMYVTWKQVAPEADIGFDLSQEYQAALQMFKRQGD
jgi:Flp pilus assembly protein TadD